jgi:hypothetical protein
MSADGGRHRPSEGIAIEAIASAEAAPNTGSGPRGRGFSCDVNTNQCKCDGIWEGADCKAMQKNCDLSKPTACTIYPPHECTCTFKSLKRPPMTIRPVTPPATVKPNP